jgi:hypothetical protein
MKQTAVEWFFNEMENLRVKAEITNMDGNDFIIAKVKLLQQAKAMEKEQHQETWETAHQAGRFEGKGIAEENWQTFETYWEENFKSE